MTDFEIVRGFRPSFRPALERLESRLVPSVVTYTNFQFQDMNGVQQYETFQWDSQDMTYSAALGGIGSSITAHQSLVGALTTLYNSDDGSTLSGMTCDEVTAMDGSCNGDSYLAPIGTLAQNSTLEYKYDTSGVTIDSSVVDNATAHARAVVLVNDARTRYSANIAILTYCQGLDTTSKVAAYLWYGQTLQHNNAVAQKDIAELKLIQASYPGAFR